MKFTRRQAVVGAVAGAVGAGGIYELIDQLTGDSPTRTDAAALLREQHLLDGIRVVRSNGIEVLVPPLHHEVVTARVTASASDVRHAQGELASLLASLDRDYAASPAGLGVTLAWGLPYFDRLVPAQTGRLLPHDRRASKPVLIDARRFPSDPPDTRLESNDVAILLRSDVRAHILDAEKRLRDSKLFRFTSIRRGFAGGGFDGAQSLPKKMALAAQIPGADLIPETSELFLGFTSTQKAGMGPGPIANFETLGYVDFRGSDYFRHGTHMHLSHIHEDVEAWYINFEFDERVATAFRPNLQVKQDTQTVRQGAKDVSSVAAVRRDYRNSGRIGHSAAIQTTSRLLQDVVAADGTVFPKGTAIPVRADFNTLDNPFAWSERADEVGVTPAAGVHFVVFNPTGDDFHRNRLAMDGVLPGGKIPFKPRAREQGFNSVLSTTHRQNFLVPPRRHRAFPLAELGKVSDTFSVSDTPRLAVRLDDAVRVAVRVAQPEHRRDLAAVAADLGIDVDARVPQRRVVGIDVGRVEDDPRLGTAGPLPGRGRSERDRRRRAGDGDLDPARVGPHRQVDDLLEPERVDVEVDRPIGVRDADRDAADLGEIQAGHFKPPTRVLSRVRPRVLRELIGARRRA
jgi:hypothetical protein